MVTNQRDVARKKKSYHTLKKIYIFLNFSFDKK